MPPFAERVERLCSVLGATTQGDLAVVLGVSQSAVSRALQRNKIPAAWLLIATINHGINPRYITGESVSKYVQEVVGNSKPPRIQMALKDVSDAALLSELQRRLSAGSLKK